MQKLSGEVVSVLGELAELQAASLPCASHDSRVVELIQNMFQLFCTIKQSHAY